MAFISFFTSQDKKNLLYRFWLTQSIAFILLPLLVYFLIFFALRQDLVELLKLPEWMFIALAFFADTARVQLSLYSEHHNSEHKYHEMLAITTIGIVVSTVFLVFSTLSEYNQEFKDLLGLPYYIIQIMWFFVSVFYSLFSSVKIGEIKGIDRLLIQTTKNKLEGSEKERQTSNQITKAIDNHMYISSTAVWLAQKHKEESGLQITIIAGDNYIHKHTRDYKSLTPNEILYTVKSDDSLIDIIDKSGAIVGRLMNISPIHYDEFSQALELCYGKNPLKLEFIQYKEKQEKGKRKLVGWLTAKVKSKPIIFK